MYEMGLRRMLNDAINGGNPKLIEKISGLFNGDEWGPIQFRYGWWVIGVKLFMEQERCVSLEVMTEKLQDKIRNASTPEEVMDIRMLFDGENWTTIQARFCWWMLGLEKFWVEVKEYQ